MIKIECNSNDKVLKGLLTNGKNYNCIEINTIGDCLVLCDDTGKSNWYKIEFFKDFYSLIDESNIKFVSARI